MIELSYFLAGSLVTLVVAMVYHRFSGKREEIHFRLVGRRFGEVGGQIREAKASLTSLTNSSQQIHSGLKKTASDVRSINEDLGTIPSEIKKLVDEARKIERVRNTLEANMKAFKSFVETVEAIQEHGVEVVARGEEHPDLHEKIVLLFAKQSVMSKLVENVGSALSGAVTGFAYGRSAEEPVHGQVTDGGMSRIMERLDRIAERLDRIEP